MNPLSLFFYFLLLAVFIPACQSSYDYPYQNPDEATEKRVENLVSLLTREEKISLLHVTSPAIPRLGIEEYHYGNEALHGIVRRNGPATVFPMPIGMAATWNPELINQVASAISDEAHGKRNEAGGRLSGGAEFGGQFNGLLTFFSPTINMARDPRWGRTAETYGEDPLLTEKISRAFITGMQGNHERYLKTICTPKHFVANNEEHNRFTNNVKVAEKTLREYYFPAYKASVISADAGSIMAAYNAVNGVPCNANHWLLTRVLRQEWGFKGYVVADCGAIAHLYASHQYSENSLHAASDAINAGVDLECGGKKDYLKSLPEALDKGLVTEATIDRAVSNILNGRFRLGMFDPPKMNPYRTIKPDVVGSEKHVNLALQSARESMVLLKNDQILPLDFERHQNIMVTGPNANVCQLGERNYTGIPKNQPVTPLAGIKSIFPDKANIQFVPWVTDIYMGKYAVLNEDYVQHAEETGISGFKSEYFHNNQMKGALVYSRIDPEINFNWHNQAPDPFYSYDGFSVKFTGKLNPAKSGKYEFRIKADGKYRIKVNQDKILENNESKADEPDFFLMNLSKDTSYTIEIEYYQVNTTNPAITLEWKYARELSQEDILAAYREQAMMNDVVLCFMGLSSNSARETVDRQTLSLPENQVTFLKNLYKANPNVVLVLINGNPLEVSWSDAHLPAILEAWFPGEQGGRAIAEVLSGTHCPAGRLPLTFYQSVEQLTPFDDYEISNGKTYMYLQEKPLYAFGHGLSYTRFEYGDLILKNKNLRPSDNIHIQV